MNFDIKSWSTQELVACLQHSGYGSDDILSAEYKFTTLDRGVAVFEISYEDIESSTIEYARVFVSIRDGRLVAEY